MEKCYAENVTLHSYEVSFFMKLETSLELQLRWNELLSLESSTDQEEFIHSVAGETCYILKEFYSKSPECLLSLIHEEQKLCKGSEYLRKEDAAFGRFLAFNNFTVLVLDELLHYKPVVHLPRALFKLTGIVHLSLRHNGLRRLPADIGRLQHLRGLMLTGNKLKNESPSLPYSLSFCEQLETLYLDSNSLDAVPGFVLRRLHRLRTLYRHGNQNYFRSIFIWYGCAQRVRVHRDVYEGGTNDATDAAAASSPASGKTAGRSTYGPRSLKYYAAKSIVETKRNFFLDPSLSEAAKDFIADVYPTLNVCEYCNSAKLLGEEGYHAYTFKSPYLGNSCVPFQHWTCSMACGSAIEQPAREEQARNTAVEEGRYRAYVEQFALPPTRDEDDSHASSLLCGLRRRPHGAANEAPRRTCVVM